MGKMYLHLEHYCLKVNFLFIQPCPNYTHSGPLLRLGHLFITLIARNFTKLVCPRQHLRIVVEMAQVLQINFYAREIRKV